MGKVIALKRIISAALLVTALTWSETGQSFTRAEDWLRTFRPRADLEAGDTVTGKAQVEAVDHDRMLITLAHEEVRSRDGSLVMPRMPMTLPVAVPGLLHLAKPGDRVVFTAGRRRGAIIIIALAPAADD